MRVALFVPCYIDQVHPDVAFAALELLQSQGVEVHVPAQQTCCGQPLINTGASAAAAPLGRRFEDSFSGYDFIVCPSGSCTATLHRQAPGLSSRVVELSQFLVGVLGVQRVDGCFPHRVLLHESCHGLRDLGLGRPSELGPGPAVPNPARLLLEGLREITLVAPARADECCGFGGSFAVLEPALSARIGSDRLVDFERAGAAVVTSGDMSCLMHLSGLMRRQGRPMVVMHLAQILAGRPVPEATRERAGGRS
jgi:L-lactate dehydrogenase complex protein LldE